MDIKLLPEDGEERIYGYEALVSASHRKRRRESFYRSLLRCAALSLLFTAAGCLLVIYSNETGGQAPFRYVCFSPPDGVRGTLKLVFICALLPSVCACLCHIGGGALAFLCDTVAPALYGTVFGCALFCEYDSLASSFSVVSLIDALPGLCFSAVLLAVYTVICPVFASYGRCRREGTATGEDSSECFNYYMISVSVIAAAAFLFLCCSAFFENFG